MIHKEKAKEAGIKTIDNTGIIEEEKANKVAQLKALIPNLINSDNQLNIEALKNVIGIENTTSNSKGYELTFAGKGIARAQADTPTHKELKREKAQSKYFEETNNVVIRGDNLEVLKILKQNYYNKIKIIYIDPPYNTKSENFIYNDTFRQSEEELVKIIGEETFTFLQNIYSTKSHSGWLAFMYPRLKLAKDLLTDDGVIFISIDDNEQANLKIMCDEIFGEENFIDFLKWNKTSTPPSLGPKIRQKYEFILCYEKKKTCNTFNAGISEDGDMPLLNESNKINTLTIPKESILFKIDGLYSAKRYGKVELLENIEVVQGCSNKDIKLRGRFKWTQDTVLKEVENGTTFIIKTHTFSIRYKRKGIRRKKPSDIISKNECNVETNEHAHKEQKALFENRILFNNPKPVSLIKYILKFISHKDDIVLDFFAGSGTTGEAVMQMNVEDGGSRRYILVQLDEEIKEGIESYNFCKENNLEPVISSITIERLHRAGEKIKKEWEKELNLYIDIGYKVFSLTDKPKITERNSYFAVENKRSEISNVLYNMLCATGKPLCIPIEEIKKDAMYKADDEIYIVRKVTAEEIGKYNTVKINIDGWNEDMSLEDWLNLNEIYEERPSITVVY